MNMLNRHNVAVLGDRVDRFVVPRSGSALSYSAISMISGMLVIIDSLSIILSAFITTSLLTPAGTTAVSGLWTVTSVGALLGPVILYDRHFGAVASRGRLSVLVRNHSLRFALFSFVLLALGMVGLTLPQFPAALLVSSFGMGWLLTATTRALMALYVRRLQRCGVLTEVVAIVGAGPVAERLINALHKARADSIDVLGIFDDKIIGAAPGTRQPDGNLAQLLELGKTRKIDWILLTLPPTAEQRVLAIVNRLKALSVSIGLCPQNVGLTASIRSSDYVGNTMPVQLLENRPAGRREALMAMTEEYLPRWLITLMLLPVMVLEKLFRNSATRSAQPEQSLSTPLSLQIDNYNTTQFTTVAAGFGHDRYGYVVTPNVDHVIRLHEDSSFRALYADASYTLLDSRFLSHLLRLTKGMHLPVCTGSDMTEKLFSEVILPNDPLVLVGGSAAQAQLLRERYGIQRLAHFNPPMGFIHNPEAVESCLNFIEARSPFRFCLLAVGAPQQEVLAQQLKVRGTARGLALCIGASINFLTGDEQRAPRWMQYSGIEWLFRLMQAPGRMARRYLVRGPRVFGLLRRTDIVLRKVLTPQTRPTTTFHLPIVPTIHASEPIRRRLVVVPNHPVSAMASSSDSLHSSSHAESEKRTVNASI